MSVEVWTYILVGITFAAYLYIGYYNRVRDTKGFYVAGQGVPGVLTLQHTIRRAEIQDLRGEGGFDITRTRGLLFTQIQIVVVDQQAKFLLVEHAEPGGKHSLEVVPDITEFNACIGGSSTDAQVAVNIDCPEIQRRKLKIPVVLLLRLGDGRNQQADKPENDQMSFDSHDDIS